MLMIGLEFSALCILTVCMALFHEKWRRAHPRSRLRPLTVVATVAWDVFVADHVYHCTDSVPFGYLSPGDWVHGAVEQVDRIGQHTAMAEPDTIKTGWTVARLWELWLSFVLFSVAVSAWAASRPWRPAARATPFS